MVLKGLGIPEDDSLPAQMDPSGWPAMKKRFEDVFATKSRDEWAAVFEGTDACVSPVLTMDEAPTHPHNVARSSFMPSCAGRDEVAVPAAPRMSETPGRVDDVPGPARGAHTREVLREFGVSAAEIDELERSGGVTQLEARPGPSKL